MYRHGDYSDPRFATPEAIKRSRRGLSGTLQVRKPPYPVNNTAAGEGWSPSIPRSPRSRGFRSRWPRLALLPWRRISMCERRTVLVAVRVSPPRPPYGGRRPQPLECRCRHSCGGPWYAPGHGPPRRPRSSTSAPDRSFASAMTSTRSLAGRTPKKTAAEAVEVIAHLITIKRALAALPPSNPDSDARLFPRPWNRLGGSRLHHRRAGRDRTAARRRRSATGRSPPSGSDGRRAAVRPQVHLGRHRLGARGRSHRRADRRGSR